MSIDDQCCAFGGRHILWCIVLSIGSVFTGCLQVEKNRLVKKDIL